MEALLPHRHRGYVKTTQERIVELRRRREQARTTDPQAAERQHDRGKLTARERVEAARPWLVRRADAFAVHRVSAFGMERRKPLGDGVITGHGTIDGRPAACSRRTLPCSAGRWARCSPKDLQGNGPGAAHGRALHRLNDSGGARIQEGVSLGGYAEIFYQCAGIGRHPQLSLIAGPCAGGAVYSPAMTDFILMVKGSSQMFITGPDVIKTVTNEDVGFEELGGALAHNGRSGVALRRRQRGRGLRAVRTPFVSAGQQPGGPALYPARGRPERMDEALQTIIPDSPKKPYDMRASRRGGGRRLLLRGPATVGAQYPGFARLDGFPIGVIANQPAHLAGVLDIDSSVKAARFVRFCDAFNIPLVTFVDVPGFLPGTQQYGGIIRHGAKLLYAYCEATVPKLTVITRKAYGGAYDVMSSKHIRADFNFAWPTADRGDGSGWRSRSFPQGTDRGSRPSRAQAELAEDYQERFANPYVAAERGYIDEVIEPKETRPALIRALRLARNKRQSLPARKHGNIPL